MNGAEECIMVLNYFLCAFPNYTADHEKLEVAAHLLVFLVQNIGALLPLAGRSTRLTTANTISTYPRSHDSEHDANQPGI
jgi:hypothetical protein